MSSPMVQAKGVNMHATRLTIDTMGHHFRGWDGPLGRSPGSICRLKVPLGGLCLTWCIKHGKLESKSKLFNALDSAQEGHTTDDHYRR